MESFEEFLSENLMGHSIWLAATYGAVIVAMGADLLTGVRKARLNGQKRNSRGYKQTCEKAMRYFLPMICLSCIDIIATVLLDAPFLTMIFGAYCIFCELKSIMESTREKAEIRRSAETMARIAASGTDIKEIIAGVLKEIIAEYMKEDTDEKH